MLEFFKKHQQKFALIAGYVLTASLFFGLGGHVNRSKPPDIKIEEPPVDIVQLNNILNQHDSQTRVLVPSSTDASSVAGENTGSDCGNLIKGNIGSSGKIYHVPGGAFYNRTVPELCFATEAEAQSAGFRKSSR